MTLACESFAAVVRSLAKLCQFLVGIGRHRVGPQAESRIGSR